MKLRFVNATLAALAAGLCLCLLTSSGCSKKEDKGTNADDKTPVFRLAWSEYPSWSVFGVASEMGLIDGREGKQGSLEKKWGVDIVLELSEYEPSIQRYASASCDAVCVTNIDILGPATSRKSVAILPTSTSVGADACLVVGIDVPSDRTDKQALKKAVQQLRKYQVHGFTRSVSEYTFDRNLRLLGEDPRDYQFRDEQAATAAAGMQAGRPDHKAIMVWNPYVLQVLKDNKEARRLFDSSTIPNEIIDLVVVARDSLDKPKGKEFACCLIDCFYEMSRLLQGARGKERADEILVKLGEKFSKLDLDDMRAIVEETRFYKTRREALTLFKGKQLPETMKLVTRFCLEKGRIKKAPSCAFGIRNKFTDVQLRFEPSYIEAVRDRD